MVNLCILCNWTLSGFSIFLQAFIILYLFPHLRCIPFPLYYIPQVACHPFLLAFSKDLIIMLWGVLHVWSLFIKWQPVCRASTTSMASRATAILVFEGTKWHCWDSDFHACCYIQTFPPSFLWGFRCLSHKERSNFLCVFTSLGFESHRFSGAKDEINMPGIEGLTARINRSEWWQS